MVKKVQGWQTDDGMFFGDEQEAIDHEALEKLRQFVADAGIDGDDEDVLVMLWRHRARVVEILRQASLPTALEKIST